jgi:beta-glucanase (GH16 family)
MKFQNAPGAWPALWLLPIDLQQSGPNQGCGWPHNGEIDMLEYWTTSPDQVSVNFHSGDCQSNTHIYQGQDYKFSGKWLNSFHEYAVEWDENSIQFFIDDELIFTQRKRSKDQKTGLPYVFPDNPMYMIMNLTIEKAIGAARKSRPDPNNFPYQEMLIDWVRVYEECDGSDQNVECLTFDTTDAIDKYNTSKHETAEAELRAFPNPAQKGQNLTIEFMLKQSCQETAVNIFDMNGRQIAPHILTTTDGGALDVILVLRSRSKN